MHCNLLGECLNIYNFVAFGLVFYSFDILQRMWSSVGHYQHWRGFSCCSCRGKLNRKQPRVISWGVQSWKILSWYSSFHVHWCCGMCTKTVVLKYPLSQVNTENIEGRFMFLESVKDLPTISKCLNPNSDYNILVCTFG